MKVRVIIDLEIAEGDLSDAIIIDAVEQNTYQYAVTSHLKDALKWTVTHSKTQDESAGKIAEVHNNWADMISKAETQIVLRPDKDK